MYLLAIDTETTGLDINTDDILELGYAIYHIDNPAPIRMKSFFLTNKKPIEPIITEITHITQDIIDKAAINPTDAFNELVSDMIHFDIKWFVGQNIVEYDYPILKNNFKRCGLAVPEVRLLDTKTDVAYTVKSKSMSLTYIAADHGFINPFPHRALTDAMTCMVLLYKYDIRKCLDVAETPMIEIRADVNFDSRDLAKALQYNWDADRKIWVKKIREYNLKQETQKASFQVIVLRKNG